MVPADEPTPPANTDPSTVVEFDGPASDAVVTAVASEAGVDPLRMTPLYQVVEPDALDALVAHARTATAADESDQWLSFRYEGYEVFVCGDGRVFLEPDEETR